MLTEQILSWIGKKETAIENGEITEHANSKIFGLGVLRGLVDGAVIYGPIMLTMLALVAVDQNYLKKD